ncbi:MAG: hypothetical protein JHC95_18070 [Solirubrobacteraceae bacterium]|nr:hypothetical protein [Solirubrobacteraceae bacterium]
MSLARLRPGEILAAVAAIGLLVVLGAEWFELHTRVAVVGVSTTGYASLGWFAIALLIFGALCALGLAVATVFERSPRIPVAMQTLTVFSSFVALICVSLRLIFQPGLGVGADDTSVDLLPGAYLGFAFTLLMFVGAWISIADERTGSRFSREQTERVLSLPGVERPVPLADGEGR